MELNLSKYYPIVFQTRFSVGARSRGFYNIAHMTNNIPSIDWAMEQGANSIEIDLQFKDDGTPYKFFHSSTCDCSCMCGA